MSLNFNTNITKPCTKPYKLSLNDCLACSGCISDQDVSDYSKKIDLNILKDHHYLFVITPHAKINMYNEIIKILENQYSEIQEQKKSANKINHTTNDYILDKNNLFRYLKYHQFEDLLLNFVFQKYSHKIVDTSHAYKIMYKFALQKLSNNTIITFSCPGVIAYIERKGHHLINNLLKCKSPQQILCDLYKTDNIISVVTCYDKKLEEVQAKYTISTIEYFTFLIDNGFLEYLHQNLMNTNYTLLEKHKFIDKNTEQNGKTKKIKDDFNNKNVNGTHKTCQINEQYIEYFCEKINYETVEECNINKNFTIYTCKINNQEHKYARIYGLPNFLNYINKSKKSKDEYRFVEAFICDYACINGPVQIKNKLEIDLKYLEQTKCSNNCKCDTQDNNIDRNFEIKKQNKKEYKIEW